MNGKNRNIKMEREKNIYVKRLVGIACSTAMSYTLLRRSVQRIRFTVNICSSKNGKLPRFTEKKKKNNNNI